MEMQQSTSMQSQDHQMGGHSRCEESKVSTTFGCTWSGQDLGMRQTLLAPRQSAGCRNAQRSASMRTVML